MSNDKPPLSLASAARTPTPVTAVKGPDAMVRAILEPLVAPDPLPDGTLTLHYIRSVANGKYSAGEDQDSVIYGPEFLYVLDVGMPMFPAVEVAFRTVGNGDPHFPDFSEHRIWSVESLAANRLLFAVAPGQLLVGVKEGIPEDKVRKELAAYASAIEVLIPNTYLAHVKMFREPEIGVAIEQNVDFVRYTR